MNFITFVTLKAGSAEGQWPPEGNIRSRRQGNFEVTNLRKSLDDNEKETRAQDSASPAAWHIPATVGQRNLPQPNDRFRPKADIGEP